MVLMLVLGFSAGETENVTWRWVALFLTWCLVVTMMLWHFVALQNTEELVQELGNRLIAVEQKATALFKDFGQRTKG
ncbi:MAG: hypothetical protein AAB463_02985 [Patescibacteria group bacterium]